MPGRGGKRGFKKLPNSEEVAVLVDDGSGSEIQLLDMTDLKNHRNGGLSVVHDGAGSSCCSWFVPLYMVLLTFLLVLLTIFQLYVAYNVQLLRSDVSDITTQVNGLEDDLFSLQLTVQQMNQTHGKELVTVTKGLQKDIDSIGVDIKEFKAKVQVLETIQKQQVVDQVKKFNKSLSVVYSFAQEVEDIHQSIAELASTVSSLDGQVKKVKQSVGDTATSSEQMSGVVQNVQDTLTVVQGKMANHEKELSSELAEIHYQLGNMTRDMDSMDWMDQSSLSSFIETIIANSSNSSMSRPPSEVSSDDLAKLEGKVDELQIQTDSLATNMTSLKKSVSLLESTVRSLTDHIHIVYPPNEKNVTEVKNSTNPTGNDGSVSTDTQSKTDESQDVANSPGSSKQPEGKQNENVSSTDSHPSEEDPSRVNRPDVMEDADVATVAVTPTPTIAPSLVSATDSSVAFARASRTISNAVNYISTDEMEMPTKSAPKPTSLPSAMDGGEMVTRPNDTDVEQSEDSNQNAIQFVEDLLRNFPYLDRNGDGHLSADEFSHFSKNADVFGLLDVDHNGYLTKEELTVIVKNLRLKMNEENKGIDESWMGDQHKPAETENVGDKNEDEDATDEDDSFNWQDYV